MVGDGSGIDDLITQLIKAPQSSQVSVAANVAKEGQMLSLVTAVTTCFTITSLSLPSNHVDDVMAEKLGKWVAENNKLLELKLDRNNITAQGALFLSYALRKNSSLQILELQDNQIGMYCNLSHNS